MRVYIPVKLQCNCTFWVVLGFLLPLLRKPSRCQSVAVRPVQLDNLAWNGLGRLRSD